MLEGLDAIFRGLLRAEFREWDGGTVGERDGLYSARCVMSGGRSTGVWAQSFVVLVLVECCKQRWG